MIQLFNKTVNMKFIIQLKSVYEKMTEIVYRTRILMINKTNKMRQIEILANCQTRWNTWLVYFIILL